MPRRLAGKIPTVLLIPGVGRESLTDKPGRLDCEAAKYLHTTAQYFHATLCHTLTMQAQSRNTRHSAGPELGQQKGPLLRRFRGEAVRGHGGGSANQPTRLRRGAFPALRRPRPGRAGDIFCMCIYYRFYIRMYIFYMVYIRLQYITEEQLAGGRGRARRTDGEVGLRPLAARRRPPRTKHFAGAAQRRGWRWAGWQCPAVDDEAGDSRFRAIRPLPRFLLVSSYSEFRHLPA